MHDGLQKILGYVKNYAQCGCKLELTTAEFDNNF